MTKPKKPDISEEEAALFRDAMRGVKPLAHTKITAQKKILTPRRPPKIDDLLEESFPFSDYERLDPVKSDDFLEFSRSGIQHKVLRNMRRGQYNAEAILDLHGKTSAKARESLSEFLLQCQHEGVRHILIIHGKGRDSDTPILKNKVNNWLRQTEQVIAFCTATPKHGGSGALYVLLRRQH
jgi:DNA-nicking Smr family endonuclease